MSYAGDKLYDGYLRTNMPTIVTKVKAREIVVHLPCLTAHDRECIEAKREMCGNFDAMVLLLDCLKRRSSWPDHFIQALEKCEHSAIAADVRAEYGKLVAAARPPSPNVEEATVTTAPSVPPTPERRPAASPDLKLPAPMAEIPPPDRDHPEPEENSDSETRDGSATVAKVSSDLRPPSGLTEARDSSASESSPGSDDGEAQSSPGKAPVQDTGPPVQIVTTAKLPTEDNLEVQRSPPSSPPTSPVQPETSEAPPLSVPHPLVSVRSPEPPDPVDALYSGDSDRLEISRDQLPSSLDQDDRLAPNGDAGAIEEEPAPGGKSRGGVKYAVTAVGVATCALLLAWKFKH
ncbi:mitochondrial antiviral-signaling protein [Stigmatopora nigra]